MTSVTRYRDWQSRLAGFVASRETSAFAWGSNDCALFVCDAIQAISGHDPAAPHRGYSDERKAARIVKNAGGMKALGDSLFGEEIHPMLARIGDVGLVQLDGRESFVLCGGSFWLGAGEVGLQRIPSIGSALVAWRSV